MKPATFFLAFTLILLFTKPSLSSRAIVDDTIVYDTDGNPLQKGASYFISPPLWGPLGDTVTLASPNNGVNETCTEAYVVQLFLNFDTVISFTFTPVALNEDAIKLGSPLAIQSAKSPCEGSTVWQVSSRIGVPNIITTGGIINTPSSCLRIIKSEATVLGDYIFEYCPYLCGAGPKICLPIGNYMGGLSPKGERPFGFVLRKGSESAAAI